MSTPAAVLAAMLAHDNYTSWLGLEVEEIAEGYCRLHYTIRADMLNGFATAHGGILFSASDSAFAFACNTHGRLSVALDVHISFMAPAHLGDLLTVEAREIKKGDKVGFYHITTTNELQEIVAVFHGTAYRTSRMVIAQPGS